MTEVVKQLEPVNSRVKQTKVVMKVAKKVGKRTTFVKKDDNGNVIETIKNMNQFEDIVTKENFVKGKVMHNEWGNQTVLNGIDLNEVGEQSNKGYNQYIWESSIVNAKTKGRHFLVILYTQIIFSLILDNLLTFNYLDIFEAFL